jgi:hypothetical protein
MFDFLNLNQHTRSFMLEAIDEASESGNIYYSTRLNELGKKQWLPLLKQAALEYNEHWLAFKLEELRLFKDLESAQAPSGGYTIKHIPNNAAETLSEGRINRFYILGLCKVATTKNIQQLIVYRAKESLHPRPESELLINKAIAITEIESQLKDTQSSFKSKLVQPNSGISMRLP